MDALLKKRMTIMGIALVVVFGGLIGFNLVKSLMIKWFFAHYQPPAVTVSSVKVQKRNWEPKIPAVGNIVATAGVDVNSEVAGKIVALHFDSGQFVTKDSPLIEIDDSVDMATLKFNQSDLALQELNFKRQSDLIKRGATSTSSLDESRAKLLQAQANVEKSTATIRLKHISAPFSGQLGIRQVNLGEYVTPGKTAIVSLQAMDPLYLQFYVPEHLIKKLSLNQKITFAVEQNPGLLFQGQITALNSKVDVNTHNILVQATIPNCPSEAMKDPAHSNLVKVAKHNGSDKTLVICDSNLNQKNQIKSFSFIPGIFASIEVQEPEVPNVLVLPATAISYSLYGNSVFIIEKDKDGKQDADGKDILTVKRVFVSTGEQSGNDIQILKGLSEGQEVVSVGELKLQDGTPVLINNDVLLNKTVQPGQLSE